jgi:hypothetical protein
MTQNFEITANIVTSSPFHVEQVKNKKSTNLLTRVLNPLALILKLTGAFNRAVTLEYDRLEVENFG